MKPSGKVNPVTVLLLLAIGGAVYWAVMFGPMYLDNFEVREAVDSAWSLWATDGEDHTYQWLLNRLNNRTQMGTMGSHFEVDEDGVEKLLPGLGVPEDNITFAYDENTKMLTVRVEYQRVVVLKPSDKRRTMRFVVEKRAKVQ